MGIFNGYINVVNLSAIHSLVYTCLPVESWQQCTPRKCSWLFKAHIGVLQAYMASECRLTKYWGFASLANCRNRLIKG